MATTTGIASNYLDLLTQLRDFLVANGWVQIGGTSSGAIAADTEFVSLRGVGLTGDDEILVTLQPYSIAANNAYSIRVRGHTAYAAPGVDQPGADSPWGYLLTLNSPIAYWFVCNGRRFMVVAKSSSRYDAMYAGFILPEHLPSDWSYPLFIGASSWTGSAAQSSDEPYHSNFWNAIAGDGSPDANNDNPSGSSLFGPLQSWVPIRNGYQYSNIANYVQVGRMTTPWSRTLQQNVRRQLDGEPWLRQGQIVGCARDSSGASDINMPEGGVFYGSFDGVYYTPSFGATAEQEAVVSGKTYLMVPNVGRTSDGHFAAIVLE